MSNKEVVFLVSFTVEGDDPQVILANELVKIDNPSITNIEVVEDLLFDEDSSFDDDDFDFIGGLEDDYDFFGEAQ
jgi:hypothetical protein